MPDPQPNLTVSTFQVARRVWATGMVRGALFLVVGIVMYLWTSVALDVLTWLLAVLLWLQAVVLLVEAQRLRAAAAGGPAASGSTGNGMSVARLWRLVAAALAVIAGLAVVVWPDKSVTLVLRIVAVWALVVGIVGVVGAVRAYRARRPSWSWTLTTSLLWLVFGALVLVKPLKNLPAMAVVLSVYLVVTGIVLLVSGFALHVEERDAARRDAPAAPSGPVDPVDAA